VNTEVIGIIGGKGKLGSAFAEYFKGKGFSVLVSDTNTKLTNEALAQKSDIVIICVPIEKTESVIRSVAPHIQEESLLMDFTSFKQKPVEFMLQNFSGSVLGAHPLFGPTNLSAGQTMVLCPGRGKKWYKRIQEVFSDFSVVKMPSHEHDQCMSLIQGVQHFMETVYGATLRQIGIPPDILLSVASPVYRLQMSVVGRILSQDENLYSQIVFGTEYSQEAIRIFTDLAQQIQKGGEVHYKNAFSESRSFLGDYCQKAQKESDILINLLSADLAKEKDSAAQKQFHAEIGTLGPSLTWSDLALDHFLSKKKKKLFPNFLSIFAALQKGEIENAFLPIENKISGTVCEVWDDIADEDLWVDEVFDFSIDHLLAAPKKGKPTQIFGHAHAIAQTRKTLQKSFPKARLVPVASNSEAVFRARSFDSSAAICSKQAAKAANFLILKKNISDQKGNVTRFALVP
jgi:prephenate dehydrogenase